MAKTTVLRERGTNEVMYPQTLARFVRTDGGDNMEEALSKAKLALFDDMFRTAAGIYGDIDHSHIEDGVCKPYYLNKIWLTYEEALKVMDTSIVNLNSGIARNGLYRSQFEIKTVLPFNEYGLWKSWSGIFDRCWALKYVSCQGASRFELNEADSMFNACSSLVAVLSEIGCGSLTSVKNMFSGCVKLESVKLRNVNCDISFADSPLISLESLRFMVDNRLASQTKPITITVHPVVYTKLTDENNAEWHQVLTDAALKNINFATT